MNIDLGLKRVVSISAMLGVLALGSTLASVASAAAGSTAAGVPAVARAARSMSIHEIATMRLVGQPKGHVVNERGTVSGTYRGSVEARFFAITSTKWEATLTVYTQGGSLKVQSIAHARLKKGEEVFGVGHFLGTASITGGTGIWAHTSGSLDFSGTINRRTLQATADISGTLNV